ncbi:hypothetical protein [cf. Phormidesmis sp. LEGE 11477]|uniref:hypothetical protein n=1 Tax=cf. Phormidesmis sp. LEGE 11477 TaxID=1828680 RepID=UPI0018805CD4|nr:hypothetical protein [cf. Phormidesmis sp. LEGE 11477]MBE9064060.1 hypothetical protein [cf. Phormidesmis sp. LEGE 11477]
MADDWRANPAEQPGRGDRMEMKWKGGGDRYCRKPIKVTAAYTTGDRAKSSLYGYSSRPFAVCRPSDAAMLN